MAIYTIGRLLAKSDLGALVRAVDTNGDGQLYRLYDAATGTLKFRNRKVSAAWELISRGENAWTGSGFKAEDKAWVGFSAGRGSLNLYAQAEIGRGGPYVLLASGDAAVLLGSLADVAQVGGISLGFSFGDALHSERLFVVDPEGALDEEDHEMLAAQAGKVTKLVGKEAATLRNALAKALDVKAPALKPAPAPEKPPSKPAKAPAANKPAKKPTSTKPPAKKKRSV